MPGLTSRENGKKGGRPRGSVSKETIDKTLKREELRRIVCSRLEAMTLAQMRAAEGLHFAAVRRPDGSLRRIESKEEFDLAVKNEEHIEITVFPPSTQAYTDLMNRALDKPSEHHEITGVNNGPMEVIQRVIVQRGPDTLD